MEIEDPLYQHNASASLGNLLRTLLACKGWRYNVDFRIHMWMRNAITADRSFVLNHISAYFSRNLPPTKSITATYSPVRISRASSLQEICDHTAVPFKFDRERTRRTSPRDASLVFLFHLNKCRIPIYLLTIFRYNSLRVLRYSHRVPAHLCAALSRAENLEPWIRKTHRISYVARDQDEEPTLATKQADRQQINSAGSMQMDPEGTQTTHAIIRQRWSIDL